MDYLNYHTGRPRFHFEEPTPPTPPTPPTTPTPPAPAWHQGVGDETLGFWQNKGYDVSDPKALATKLTEQYRAAEKHIGAPPDQILRLPKPDATAEEKAAFRQKLGAPAKAEEYDFSTVKDAAGQPLAQPLADALRASFLTHGIAKDTAPAVALDVVKALDSVKKTQSTVTDATLAEERGKLEKNWGGKESSTWRFNMLQAKEGAERLGLDPNATSTLETMLGYSTLMDALRKIGNARREDVFLDNPAGGGGSGTVTTRAGAVSRKAELFADKAWVTRLNAGDAEAKTEWKRLNQMIDGEAA